MSEISTSEISIRSRLQAFWQVVRWHALQMWEQFFEHNCMTSAGALTYTTLFAVVPMMAVAYTIFSLMPDYAEMGQTVQAFVFQNFVPGSSDVVQEKLNEFADRARGLTTIGLAILFGTAFMMLVTIEKTFNTIWH
ncbi:MAG: YihY family inner membrane protein, partial [Pseudomonadota bacterium]